MEGTFTKKTRIHLSEKFDDSLFAESISESARLFRESVRIASSSYELIPDLAVKAAIAGGMSKPGADNKKRVNRGGPPGMKHAEGGYRFMPDEVWAPNKVLKLFPSFEEKNSVRMTPNFGFIEDEAAPTPEQMAERAKSSPQIRIEKFKINPRTGEKIEGSEVQMDTLFHGREMPPERDVDRDSLSEKSLGDSLGRAARGSSLIGRMARSVGIIFDELGKMRCPPGTPAANQFTDAMGSNCFGISLGGVVEQLVEVAKDMVPENDYRRQSGSINKKIANFFFDLENSRFGRVQWFDEDGNRMGWGKYRKYRDAGGVAKNEKWFINAMVRAEEEVKRQGERVEELQRKLGISATDAKKLTNEDLVETIDKLRANGIISTEIVGRDTPDVVRARIIARLQGDPSFVAMTDAERQTLIEGDIRRYYATERTALEGFIDEVIKNPEHMSQAVGRLRFVNGRNKDDGSYATVGIIGTDTAVGLIDLDIIHMMHRQESLLPNLDIDERLRIYAVGGSTDVDRAAGVHDFLLSANAFAFQMATMVEGSAGIGRHTIKHEIAHSIQARAIHEHVKSMLAGGGSIRIGKKEITDPAKLTAEDIMDIMKGKSNMPLDSIKNMQTRGELAAFMAGRYIWEVNPDMGGVRTAEIGAELWALRSMGLIYGDDIDSALEYMDDVAHGKTFADRAASDIDAIDAVTNSYYNASATMAATRAQQVKERYIEGWNNRIKQVREMAKTMSEEDIVDSLVGLSEELDAMEDALQDAIDNGGDMDSLWKEVADRDGTIRIIAELTKAWQKRFTVLPSREAMDRLEELIDDRREGRGTLSPDKARERAENAYMAAAAIDAESMTLDELVDAFTDTEMSRKAPGLTEEQRKGIRKLSEIYRDEYIKRRTSGPDSIDREDALKELKAKFKEKSKPSVFDGGTPGGSPSGGTTPRRPTPRKFNSHNGANGARTFAQDERDRLLEGATAEERIALVEMGELGHDLALLLSADPDEAHAAAERINRRLRRHQKNGGTPDPTNKNIASLEEQIQNLIIPYLELMDKSSLSEDIEVDLDTSVADIPWDILQEVLSGQIDTLTLDMMSGSVVTNKTSGEKGKVRMVLPKGSKAIFPDWSFSKEKDDGVQKVVIPSGTVRIKSIDPDGTIVLELVEQDDASTALDEIYNIFNTNTGNGNWATRVGNSRKIKRVIDAHIARKRSQGDYSQPREAEPETARMETENDVIDDIFDAVDEADDIFSPDAPENDSQSTEEADSSELIDGEQSSSGSKQPIGRRKPIDMTPTQVAMEYQRLWSELNYTGEGAPDTARKAKLRKRIDELAQFADTQYRLTKEYKWNTEEWRRLAEGKPFVPNSWGGKPGGSGGSGSGGGGSRKPNPEQWWIDASKPKPRPERKPPETSTGTPKRVRRNTTRRENDVIDAASRYGRAGGEKRARETMQEVEDLIYGGYQNRVGAGGRKASLILNSKFGGRKLSELSDEELYELADLIKASEVGRRDERAMSFMSSAIIDYVNIRDMLRTGDFSVTTEASQKAADSLWDAINNPRDDFRPIRGVDPDEPPGFSSGASYQSLVDRQKPLSEARKNSIREAKSEILSIDISSGTLEERRGKTKRVSELVSGLLEEPFSTEKDIEINGVNIGRELKLVPVFPLKGRYPNRDDRHRVNLNDDGSMQIEMEFSIYPSSEEMSEKIINTGIPPSLGTVKRNVTVNPNGEVSVFHDLILLPDRSKKFGIASSMNARNELIYRELGVSKITTGAESDNKTGKIGISHWARNGFTWDNEEARQGFLKILHDGLNSENADDFFTQEEKKKIGSLITRNENGTFDTSASIEQLVDFSGADRIFGVKATNIAMKRELRPSAEKLQPKKKKWGSSLFGNRLSSGRTESRGDELEEIFGTAQSKEERMSEMADMQSSVISSMRDMLEMVPGADEELGLNADGIDPVILDFIRNSSDEEILETVKRAATEFHKQIDSRPIVRMRADELDGFVSTGRYGREGRFSSGASSPSGSSGGRIKRGFKNRIKERALEEIEKRFELAEDEKEFAEVILDSTFALKYGPKAAVAKLVTELGRRGAREVAERVIKKLVENGKITQGQADEALKRLGKIAPEGLPDRPVDAAISGARMAADKVREAEIGDRARRTVGRLRESGAAETASSAIDRTRESVASILRRDRDSESGFSSGRDTKKTTFDDISSDPEKVSSLKARGKEISGMTWDEKAKEWTAPNGDRYVIHMGASELVGGVLDPDRSRGISSAESVNGAGVSIGGNTREANLITARGELSRRQGEVNRLKDEVDLYEEVLSGRISLDRATRGGYQRGKIEPGSTARLDEISKFRLYPFDPKFMEVSGARIEEVNGERFLVLPEGDFTLTSRFDNSGGVSSTQLREGIQRVLEQSKQYLSEAEEKVKPYLEMEKYGFQHISAYPAEALRFFAFDGYGGRYADEGGDTSNYSDFDPRGQSDMVGIHVVRVTPNVTVVDTNNGQERGIIGPQKPIATIVVPRSKGSEMEEIFAGWVDSVIKDDIRADSDSGFSSGAKKRGTVITKLEDLPATEREGLVEESKKIDSMTEQELSDIFTDGEYEYVVHFGAENLDGGSISPSRIMGNEVGGENDYSEGNTRQLNRAYSNQYRRQHRINVALRDSLSIYAEKIRRGEQLSMTNPDDGWMNLPPTDAVRKAVPYSPKMREMGARRGSWDKDKDRPWPDKDDLKEMGVTAEELADLIEKGIPPIQKQIDESQKVVDLLDEHDGQFSSSYPLTPVIMGRLSGWGYGGRYGDRERSGTGDLGSRADRWAKGGRQGIHILRVKRGEDSASVMSGLVQSDTGEEVHLFGEHTPIATLQAPTVGLNAEDTKATTEAWKAWAVRAVKADKEFRASGGFSSGAKRGTPKGVGDVAYGDWDPFAPSDRLTAGSSRRLDRRTGRNNMDTVSSGLSRNRTANRTKLKTRAVLEQMLSNNASTRELLDFGFTMAQINAARKKAKSK